MSSDPHMTDSTPLLQFDAVTRRYRVGREWVSVLEDVSFQVDAGDFVGLHGERRSGKSMLLRIAAGWEPPDEGSVRFDGHDLSRLSGRQKARLRRRHGIGLASGIWRPNSNKPAIDHVAEVLLCDRVSPREAMGPALLALEQVGLSDRAHEPSDLLSQGELIRLGLAMRLAHRPRVLLVDEPAVLLRPNETAELYGLLASLGRDLGLALVIASEDIAPIRMARRRMSLDDGQLRVMDTPPSSEQPGTVVDFPAKLTAVATRQSS